MGTRTSRGCSPSLPAMLIGCGSPAWHQPWQGGMSSALKAPDWASRSGCFRGAAALVEERKACPHGVMVVTDDNNPCQLSAEVFRGLHKQAQSEPLIAFVRMGNPTRAPVGSLWLMARVHATSLAPPRRHGAKLPVMREPKLHGREDFCRLFH